MPNVPDLPLVGINATVEGRVQGVGFRWSACDEARKLGVTGWVRNTGDGSVEAHVEGSSSSVDAFVVWLRKGPPGARVDSVSLRSITPTGAYGRFSVEQ